MKKVTYLVIALLLPGMIYVFLKYFGKNQFDIPVYYQLQAPAPLQGCHPDSHREPYPVPYAVPDSSLKALGWSGGAVTLFHDGQDETAKVIGRLKEELKNDFQAIGLGDGDSAFRLCNLLMSDSFSVVVLDGERRIRGYYDPATREEADRLTVELKILLHRY